MTARAVEGRVASVLAAAALSGCARTGGTMLNPYGVVASAQRSWLLGVVLIMLVVVGPVLVLAPLFAWRYRRRGGAPYRPDWTFSRALEVLIWGVPAVVVVAMAVLIATREAAFDPYASVPGGRPIEVEVVALNWKFLFLYPEQHVASVGLLEIPQGRPIAFRLTSDATMQSFFIPALGSQIYAMAGMETRLHLRADRPGLLDGENTQFNGDQFQQDRFQVAVVSDDAFNHFVADCRAGGRTLDPAAYRTVAAQGTTAQAGQRFGVADGGRLLFGDIAPDLFRSIVAKYHPDGTMPMPVQDGER